MNYYPEHPRSAPIWPGSLIGEALVIKITFIILCLLNNRGSEYSFKKIRCPQNFYANCKRLTVSFFRVILHLGVTTFLANQSRGLEFLPKPPLGLNSFAKLFPSLAFLEGGDKTNVELLMCFSNISR